MGTVEEAGKAASGFIDALKGQPLSLALVVMNVAMLAMLFYWASSVQAARLEAIRMVLDVEKQVHEILSKCVVPSQRSDSGKQLSDSTKMPEFIPGEK